MSSSKKSDFPTRLREAREKRGFSQADLADHSGLQPSAVSHFETGHRSPSFDNLKRLSDALNVSIDFLVGREDSVATALGPEVEALFRDVKKLTHDDIEALRDMANVLAKRNAKKD